MSASGDQQPLVSIIILNWNGSADTAECLRSLRAIDYPRYEIVLVDNASQGDDVAQLRAEFGDSVRIIENDRNSGFAGGCNIGIRDAISRSPDYLLLLNNDTVVEPDFLSRMVEAARQLPDLAAACPKSYFYDEPEVLYSTGGTVNLWTASSRQVGRGERDRGQYERLERRNYADGVCMLIPRSAIDRVGLLDEDYFAYWEETDWCLRARERGLYSYYVPSARIRHKAARSSAPDSAFYYRFRRNAFLCVRKRGRFYHVTSALLLYLFWYGPRYLLRHPSRVGRLVAELRALGWHLRNRTGRRPLV